ncbi:MAG: hypothetical protein IJF67_05215 [Clostridia bacterium]|nr:hypothetical protein [Clostridia bacterium]
MGSKTIHDAGADQRTPSVPQYFSWINNTNEGSTEKHTLINLDFFAWLKKTYGMEIKIYAWDAGNFDGASMGYGDAEGEKFRSQYPNGYDPIVKKAAECGIRMGLWGSPDGFGDDPETEKKRYDFMVDLCRKYHFALFKVDGVCGTLRKEKAALYARMLQDCRKYSPDLIVLNHRLNLFEAEKYVTTFLWQGSETYVDVHSGNNHTCMHHRGFLFDRGLPEGLERLAEDHGVCISSSIAYFEDDLIYQAFGRCMIVSPEIYGNPWLMRDDEYPKLARIYNLHRRHAPILVDGTPLPDAYGPAAVSRGTGTHRFLTTGNNTWETREITIRLSEEIGLTDTAGELLLIERHPVERLIGRFSFGDAVPVTLMPHRAHLFEIAAASEADPVLENCEYQTILEKGDGTPVQVKTIFTEGGGITLLTRGERVPFGSEEAVDIREFAPIFLGSAKNNPAMLSRSEQLYEAAQFGIDNDSLEKRELRRSGPTAIPEVQAARDAFFSQKTYLARGCDSDFAFDGNPETFFDAQTRTYFGGQRIEDGCLRVDFGGVIDADTVEIVCFAADTPTDDVLAQCYPEAGSCSVDFAGWTATAPMEKSVIEEHFVTPVVRFTVHDIYPLAGKLVSVRYPLGDASLRYFRLPCPMDRIYAIRALKDGAEVALPSPRVNNMQAMYGRKSVYAVHSAQITLPDVKDGDYISAAIEGEHGNEAVYCTAELDGQLLAFPDRAAAYKSNFWEHMVMAKKANYTYYLPLTADMSGKKLTVHALFCSVPKSDIRCDLYLCPKH